MNKQSEVNIIKSGHNNLIATQRSYISDFIVKCPNNAIVILAKTTEILEIVLSQDSECWPPLEVWKTLLPEWFIQKSADEISHEEAERRLLLPIEERIKLSSRWTLSGFVYWFQPSERYWQWWNAAIIDEQTIKVSLISEETPFPWGALEWLFRAAGATSMEEC